MYKLTLYQTLLAIFFFSFATEKSLAQDFYFPTLESRNNCGEAFELTTRIEIVGIKIQNIYYDDPARNNGSFGFEVVFKYYNNFAGRLPTSSNSFWTYSYVLSTNNPAIGTRNISNNISNVPIRNNTDGTLYTTANNVTYNGSASKLGLRANQIYTDTDILNLFNFTTIKLSLNLPCLQANNVESSIIPLLPIELTDFNLENINNKVKLSWLSATEINQDKFEIERSADGINFQTIGSLNSKSIGGNSSESIAYDFIDESPLNGYNYYRLKAIDFDGVYQYSDLKVIQIKKAQKNLMVYPNPAHEQLTIDNINSNSTLELINIQGQILWQTHISESQSYQLSLTNFPSGFYYLRSYTADQNTQYQKIEIY